MRLENLPDHYLDVLIEIHVLGSKVYKVGTDGRKVDVFVRAGRGEPVGGREIPQWSSSPEESIKLMELYHSRGRPITGSTPREVAVAALRQGGVHE